MGEDRGGGEDRDVVGVRRDVGGGVWEVGEMK